MSESMMDNLQIGSGAPDLFAKEVNTEYKDANYQALALRTEAPVDGAMRDRFTNQLLTGMFFHLERAQHAGASLDMMKKFFFYGKGGTDPDANPAPYSPEQMERVQSNIRLLHAVMGILTEVSEVLEILLPHLLEGAPLDTFNLMEEGGDIYWYMAIFADALHLKDVDIRTRNISKLCARYPDKFRESYALNRDLAKERAALAAGEAVRNIFTGANPGTLATAKTMDGTDVEIFIIDFAGGYFHGQISGYPATWARCDGEFLGPILHHEYPFVADVRRSLDMTTYKEVK